MFSSLILGLALNLAPAAAACADHAAAEAAPAPTARAVASKPGESKADGQGITLTEAPLALSEAMKRKDELTGKDVLVKAEVPQVCQSMGCWLTLKDKDASVRVTFKDYSFTVPKESATRIATVQGRLIEKELSPAEARTLAKEQGKTAAEVAKIQAPVKRVAFESTGLTLTTKQ